MRIFHRIPATCAVPSTAACLLTLVAIVLITPSHAQWFGDQYKYSCAWHSDMNIKGCGYRSFKSCASSCHYCITRRGVDDECNQLKCAASCAVREGKESECLDNFRELCKLAKPFAPNCDVDCNSAMPAFSPNSTKLILVCLLTVYAPSRRTLFIGLLILGMITFQGCCSDPEPQLDWDASSAGLRTRAKMYNEDGIWRGSPTWTFIPTLEIESMICKTRAPEGYCSVWTVLEWTCEEEDFGVCKCMISSSNGKYCKEWTCHSLEADQHVCSVDYEGNQSCSYDAFPMNEVTYVDLLRLRADSLQEASKDFSWYSETSVVNNVTDWPPVLTSMKARKSFLWYDICIVTGDNVIERMQCDQWREIETELSHCNCTQSDVEETMCQKWTCEERDTGQFTILFRTNASITQWVEGVEYEEYHCITAFKNETLNGTNQCIEWEGTIGSIEEVEATKCVCDDKACSTWACDEYELPVTPQWNHPLGIGYFIGFIAAYAVLVIGGACCVSREDWGGKYRYGVCVITVLFLLLLPFCVVTIGLWGWMVISLPFYAGFATIMGIKKWCHADNDSGQAIGFPDFMRGFRHGSSYNFN